MPPVMEPLYWAISWIMLRWHALWDFVLPGREWLATNWDWVLAIVFLVITIRSILIPVFVKQIKSQRAMQALAPQIKALQEKHRGDKQTMQMELMELYRREKANPLMGCLPLAIQAPVMYSLYHVLRHLNPNRSLGIRNEYGWTLAQFDSAAHARLFGAPLSASLRSSAIDLARLHASMTNVRVVAIALVIIMAVTTYFTSRQMIVKTGWAEDPQQRRMQRIMVYAIPFFLLITGAAIPIGVAIYWVTTNLFSMGQQFWVLRKYPPPVPTGASARTGSTPARATATAAPSGLRALLSGAAQARGAGARPAVGTRSTAATRSASSARTAAAGKGADKATAGPAATSAAQVTKPPATANGASRTPAAANGASNAPAGANGSGAAAAAGRQAASSKAGSATKTGTTKGATPAKGGSTQASRQASGGSRTQPRAGRLRDGKKEAVQPVKPVVDGRSLAPKPGAKPINPKKGGATKRTVG